MAKPNIAKVGEGTRRVQREKPEAYAKVAARITAARREKGLPELDISPLGRLRRSDFGSGVSKLHQQQTTEAKKQLKKK